MKKISIAILLVMISCGTSNITEEIEGIYKFKYPSGQVEVINIKKEHTYNQKIYANDSDYLSGESARYDNDGSWHAEGKELTFEHWLSYCHLRDPDSILVQPKLSTMLNVYYDAPSDDDRGQIDFFKENGYVFEKIK